MKYTPLLLAVLLCGCKTVTTAPGELRPDQRQISIETDPPGMRIFFGIAGTAERAERTREYVGQSPCKLIVKCDEEGRFINTVSSFARPKAVFEAEPPHDAAGLFPQRQEFTVPAMFIRPAQIPAAVFFDMHKPPE